MKEKILILLLLFKFVDASTQDLYNYENTKKFAEYLAKSGQYDLSTREFERLVFMSPQNDTLKTSLLSMYRRSGKYDEAIIRGKQLYPEIYQMPSATAIEFGRILLLKSDFQTAKNFWESNQNISNADKTILSATSDMLQDNYKTANELLKILKPEEHPLAADYKELAKQAIEIKRKNPAAAGLLSAIIPGMGRVYAKDWKDGLVSFFFVSTMAIQSVRGFNKSGVKSTRGWIYGGIGFGFYLGNIYGSVVSAKSYNKKSHQSIKNKIDNLFNSYY
jgi:hypothetical protein